jgi:hypothetical protein
VSAFYLEENANRQWHAGLLGRIRALTEEECSRIARQTWKSGVVRKVWEYLVTQATTAGYLDGLEGRDSAFEPEESV